MPDIIGSPDETPIAFEQSGRGPPLIIVDDAIAYRRSDRAILGSRIDVLRTLGRHCSMRARRADESRSQETHARRKAWPERRLAIQSADGQPLSRRSAASRNSGITALLLMFEDRRRH